MPDSPAHGGLTPATAAKIDAALRVLRDPAARAARGIPPGPVSNRTIAALAGLSATTVNRFLSYSIARLDRALADAIEADPVLREILADLRS